MHVHVGAVSPFAWGAVRAARDVGVPVLVTVHSVWGPVARPGYALSESFVRWHRAGVGVSAVSTMAAHRVARALGLPRSDVAIISNGIDPAQWAIADPVSSGPDELHVVTVMRMAARKRTVPLVRMIATAARALEPTVRVRATLVGDGPDRARAERLVRSQGLQASIHFAGRLDRQQILEVFRTADVYVQPSVKESFGIAALEARTAGLPVIIRSQSGSVQFIHEGVEGLVVDDDIAMTAAIARLGRDRGLLAGIAQHKEKFRADARLVRAYGAAVAAASHG